MEGVVNTTFFVQTFSEVFVKPGNACNRIVGGWIWLLFPTISVVENREVRSKRSFLSKLLVRAVVKTENVCIESRRLKVASFVFYEKKQMDW